MQEAVCNRQYAESPEKKSALESLVRRRRRRGQMYAAGTSTGCPVDLSKDEAHTAL